MVPSKSRGLLLLNVCVNLVNNKHDAVHICRHSFKPKVAFRDCLNYLLMLRACNLVVTSTGTRFSVYLLHTRTVT